MSEVKSIVIKAKDLGYKGLEYIDDLVRFLSEVLPQITLERNGDNINIVMPNKLSKRAVKLRIKKFLHKKGLYGDFRPISYKNPDAEGYIVKEKKIIELSYY
ncbi:MAG: hypothetical protein ACFFCE_06040 [Promethearchaeota archaeon]